MAVHALHATRPPRVASAHRAPASRSRCRVAAAAAPASAAAAAALSVLLSAPPDLNAAGPAEEAAVTTLVREQPSSAASLSAVLAASDGRWEVAYAPHIRRLSAPFGTTIRPLRYELRAGGTRMRSDVRYTSPVLGAGWFSAEGRVEGTPAGDAVDVLFDSFWLQPGDAEPRADNPVAGGASVSATDAATNAIGRALFFPALSRFPVRYVDADVRLCVFEFPPLRTTIAAVRV